MADNTTKEFQLGVLSHRFEANLFERHQALHAELAANAYEQGAKSHAGN